MILLRSRFLSAIFSQKGVIGEKKESPGEKLELWRKFCFYVSFAPPKKLWPGQEKQRIFKQNQHIFRFEL